MEVIYLDVTKELNLKKDIEDLGLVLGLFDGVHIGHRELILNAKRTTKEGSLGVLTFDKALKSTSLSLMTNEDKLNEFESLGVNYVFLMVTNEKLHSMSHEDFVNKILKELNPSRLYCGPDFKFGYKALGDVNYLKENFENVNVHDFVMNDRNEKVSSTLIKSLIQKGELEEVETYLGKPYKLDGVVIHGLKKGRLFGLPTANLGLEIDYVLPQHGVYFTKTYIAGKVFKSVTNVGFNPTVSNLKHPSIETYIVDCDEDLYDERMQLEFFKRIRDEKKFDSCELLKEQVYSDARDCVEYFKYRK